MLGLGAPQPSPTPRALIVSLYCLVVCFKHVKVVFFCSCLFCGVNSIVQGLPLPVWVCIPHRRRRL